MCAHARVLTLLDSKCPRACALVTRKNSQPPPAAAAAAATFARLYLAATSSITRLQPFFLVVDLARALLPTRLKNKAD